MTSTGRFAELRRLPFVVCFCLSACVFENYTNPFAPEPGPLSADPEARPVTPPLALDNQEVSKGIVALPEPKLELNAEVKRELDHFVRKDRLFIENALRRRENFYADMREIFTREGVPHQLMNVALIESGFHPEARSYAGAVGMWQFMKPTARLYGLKVNLIQDQRKDPILSTTAAARHLRDLYLNYKDWNLALAAYNAGCGSLGKALNRAKQADFWSLARSGHLHKQTARFVPRFIASAMIMSNPSEYGFEAVTPLLDRQWASNSYGQYGGATAIINRTGNRYTPLG